MNQNSIVTKKFRHSSTRCTSKTWRNNNWCSIKWHWMPLYTILPSRDFKHTECLPSVFSRISVMNIITSNIQIMLVLWIYMYTEISLSVDHQSENIQVLTFINGIWQKILYLPTSDSYKENIHILYV